MRKNVVDTFAKEDNIYYAKHENGSIYVSTGHYLFKTNQPDFDFLISQVNRRRKTSDIAVVEKTRILDYVNNAKGTFELTQKPHEMGMSNCTACIYADEKQYFGYDKRFIAILKNYDNRLFVDDNRGYDIYTHSLIAKGHNNEVLGVALPLNVTDTMYEKLADVLPLKVKRKSEIERIKENPDNDPYIGKEFSDGKNKFIISYIRNHNGADMYLIPKIENGKVSTHADLVKVDEIEARIKRWETSRAEKKPGVKEQMTEAAKQAAKDNAKRSVPDKGGKTKAAEL
jgi:hypothetical protein